MTGERITTKDYFKLDAMVAGKTIIAATFEEDSVAMRFADGSWLYVEFFGIGTEDSVTCDPDATPFPFQLEDLGVIDRAEMLAMSAEREAAEKAKRDEADRAEFERLRKRFEGEDKGEDKGGTP